MNEISLTTQLQQCQLEVAELKNTVLELTDFFENATLPIHGVNGSGIIIWANKEELDFMGYDRDEYVGKHISNFHADKVSIDDLLARLIKKQTVKNYPAQLILKSGEIKPVLINSNVYQVGDKFVHTRCFTRDITELKKSEAIKVEVIAELHQQMRQLKEQNAFLKNKLLELSR